jgi:hypothetical protein
MYDRSLNFRLLPIGKPHISIHVYWKLPTDVGKWRKIQHVRHTPRYLDYVTQIYSFNLRNQRLRIGMCVLFCIFEEKSIILIILCPTSYMKLVVVGS